MRLRFLLFKVATILLIVISIVMVVYIIINRLGLIESLDFGAGAYFYADIPDFEKYMDIDLSDGKYSYISYLLLSIIWAIFVFFIWLKIDKYIKSRERD